MDNVINLAEKSQNSMTWTPEQALKRCLDDYENGSLTGDKVIIISIDDDDGTIDINYTQSKMGLAQLLGYAELFKDLLMNK